jgi:hypothetical protein
MTLEDELEGVESCLFECAAPRFAETGKNHVHSPLVDRSPGLGSNLRFRNTKQDS